MKLRTELPENGTCFFKEGPKDHVHDAACAHALMLAMNKMAWPAHRETLIERADEIMAEWGFDSGEEKPE